MVQATSSFHAVNTPDAASRFEVHADACIHILPRITDMLARYDLLPVNLWARRSCAGMWIGLHAHVEGPTAERLAERLRSIVGVSAVLLMPAPYADDRISYADVR